MSLVIKFYLISSVLNMFQTLIQPINTIEKSQAPDDGCINVWNMLSIEEVK